MSSSGEQGAKKIEFAEKPKLSEADEAIRLNLMIQIGITVGVFVLFTFLRPKVPWLYTPNTKGCSSHPAKGYTGRFNWIVPVLKTDDSVLLSVIGMDAFLFLQTLKLLFNIFSVLSVIVAPVLCLYYFFFARVKGSSEQIILRMSLISEKDEIKMVNGLVPCVACYLITFFIMYMVYMFYRKYIILRQAYFRDASISFPTPTIKKMAKKLGSSEKALEVITLPSKSVLLRGLPSFLKSRDDLIKFVEVLDLGKPVDAHVVDSTAKFDELSEKKKGAIRELERELQMFLIEMNRYSMRTDYFKNNFEGFDPDLDLISNAIIWTVSNKRGIGGMGVEQPGEGGEGGEKGKGEGKEGEEGKGEGEGEETEEKKKEREEAMEIVRKVLRTEFTLCKPKVEGVDSIALYIGRIEKISEQLRKDREEVKGEVNADEIKRENALFDVYDVDKSTEFLSLGRILKLKENYKDFSLGIPANTKTGFVTFEDKKTANMLKQTFIGSGAFSCKAVTAPPADEIIWSNLTETEPRRVARQLVGSFITVLFNIFFMAFVLLIVGVINVKSFETMVSLINKDLLTITQRPNFRKTFNGVVVPLVYNILLALAPIALEAICLFEGAFSYSELQKKFSVKYTVFLFINGFLALIFGSSFLTLAQTTNSTELFSNIMELLSTSSIFFLNAIIQKALSGCLFILLSPSRLVAKFAGDVLGGVKTRREEINSKETEKMNFGSLYPPTFLVFPMALMYSIICPIFLVFGAMYFFGSYIVFKSQFLYSLKSQMESGGVYWPPSCNSMFWSLIAFQVATALQLVAIHAHLSAFLIVPLVIVTLAVGNGINTQFKRKSEYLPINKQEEKEGDRFIKEFLKRRQKDILEWKEETLLTYDSLEIKSTDETTDKTYPYRDISTHPDVSVAILPEWFAITMMYLKENDRKKMLPL